jgi:hypothetical protein
LQIDHKKLKLLLIMVLHTIGCDMGLAHSGDDLRLFLITLIDWIQARLLYERRILGLFGKKIGTAMRLVLISARLSSGPSEAGRFRQRMGS